MKNAHYCISYNFWHFLDFLKRTKCRDTASSLVTWKTLIINFFVILTIFRMNRFIAKQLAAVIQLCPKKAQNGEIVETSLSTHSKSGTFGRSTVFAQQPTRPSPRLSSPLPWGLQWSHTHLSSLEFLPFFFPIWKNVQFHASAFRCQTNLAF